jgi:hypothetical protein
MFFPMRTAAMKEAAHRLVSAAKARVRPPQYGHGILLDYPVSPRARPWRHVPALCRLEERIRACMPTAGPLIERIAELEDDLLRISPRPDPERPGEPQWINPMFPAFDATVLYGLLALRNPRLYVEVGSGYSTCFARRAIRDHRLRTTIISIDPCPRAEIDALCDEVIRVPLERLDLNDVKRLSKEDLLFVDSSHRSFQNSDVTVFFHEVLPSLPAGLTYGLHDIFLPADYPEEWTDRYYNEQYLLSSYLHGGADGDEVLLPNAYLGMATKLPAVLWPIFDRLALPSELRTGTAFWLQRSPSRA